jgi:hypothetical protein
MESAAEKTALCACGIEPNPSPYWPAGRMDSEPRINFEGPPEAELLFRFRDTKGWFLDWIDLVHAISNEGKIRMGLCRRIVECWWLRG